MIFNRSSVTVYWRSVRCLAGKAGSRRRHEALPLDYFSFVGSDATGTVYLAHDNNRGQKGERFFADHWIMMYAEGTGIVPIVGSAHYPNPARELETIPDSSISGFAEQLGVACACPAPPTASR